MNREDIKNEVITQLKIVPSTFFSQKAIVFLWISKPI